VNPFEEFLKQKQESEETEKTENYNSQQGRTTRKEDDDRTTWTGKRIRGSDRGKGSDNGGGGGVGKYLKAALADQGGEEDEIVEFMDEEPEP
jgi:peptidyl-prolyl cis-trans isomerase-like protein 2